MFRLQVREVGESLGVTLPAEVARLLRVREGDRLYLTASPDGFRVSAHDPAFAATMQAAEAVMAGYRNVLRTLAK